MYPALLAFFFAYTEKDEHRGSEENYQEPEESLQQEERYSQRYYTFLGWMFQGTRNTNRSFG